ncbi:MAG TPA: peptide chain release factor 1 [Deltaproteobacteria bacterium]|nr:MAG: peptide chain release factor 1 [Deltaproteobacteria bacterium GWA2_45_12]HBF12126.1 peptide chain release factor 1 [Deltaproteobacteria bacterium]
MFSKLQQVEQRHRKLTEKLHDPAVTNNSQEFQKLAKEEASLRLIVETYQIYKKKNSELEQNKLMLVQEKDESLRELVKAEMPILEKEVEELTGQLKILLLPKDPNDDKNIFLEIRAGTGGDEAALFASDLFRMYSRYAEKNRWTVEIASESSTGIGGFKEMIVLISGERVYSKLKYESGVHRVQRVPKTEASGRIHTSAVTVAVIPEADEVEVKIDPNELRIDVYRSGGHGGQSVNTTDSAVRITHIPTGMVVICQDEKSQHKNKAKAMKVLRARLYDQMLTAQQEAEAKARKEQVKTGDRSEKIRTYNFPQNRLTDHRIGLTVYQLDSVMEGNLDLVLEPLLTHYQAEALKKSDS